MTDHRAIGVELNNRVWDTLESGAIGASSPRHEREDLIYAAYASAHHWRQVGTVANRARAEHLVSRAAAQIGWYDVAIRHAARCLELVEVNPEAMEDWDLAFALEALARGQAGAGETDQARATYARAVEAAAAISDEDDRSLVEAQLRNGPWSGVTPPV
ncbi:MAG TPA: hypothetical protein VLB67_08705 [Acidimicrobiia bacterium]|nr:hypothetical protein [Acidimicrobiia bacterium]